jgi:hypothetical protein
VCCPFLNGRMQFTRVHPDSLSRRRPHLSSAFSLLTSWKNNP